MEIRSFRSVLVLSGLLGLPLCAQDPIRGPMLGWVWDARQESIRPILGIAGSSLMGKAADLGVTVKYASQFLKQICISVVHNRASQPLHKVTRPNFLNQFKSFNYLFVSEYAVECNSFCTTVQRSTFPD